MKRTKDYLQSSEPYGDWDLHTEIAEKGLYHPRYYDAEYEYWIEECGGHPVLPQE